MAKFICEKCNKELILSKHSIKVVGDKVVTPEAVCCDQYMKAIKEKGNGLGTAMVGKGGIVRGKFKN